MAERSADRAPRERAGRAGAGRRGVYEPRPLEVRADRHGSPVSVAGNPVEAIRERWLVEDRWWTGRPLSRIYFELVLADGRDIVVMREPARDGRWFAQRA